MTTFYTNQDAHNDITEQFTQFKRIQTGRSMRMMFSNRLTEHYLAVNGKIPPAPVLDRLATLLLQDEITDPTPYKSRNTEYPITSPRQEADYCKKLTSKGVPESLGMDGVDYRLPGRRQRTPAENAHIDREMGAKRRNNYR